MSKTKALLVVLVHIALAIFVIVAIWPALKGGSEGYNTKTSGVIIAQPVAEPVAEISEPEPVVEVIQVEPVIETNQAETVVEEVVDTAVTEVSTAVTEPVVAEEPVSAAGKVHVVTAEGLKYNPLVVVIAPGDTVAWENMSSHDTQSIEGLIPDGAELWHSAMGENFQRTFTHEGIYIYKCTPHFGSGMGGAIIVGKPVNIDAITAAPAVGAAKRLVKKALQTAATL